jgi:hypothetical protein
MAAAAVKEAPGRAATADLVLELCRRLSAEERHRVVTELTAKDEMDQRHSGQ